MRKHFLVLALVAFSAACQGPVTQPRFVLTSATSLVDSGAVSSTQTLSAPSPSASDQSNSADERGSTEVALTGGGPEAARQEVDPPDARVEEVPVPGDLPVFVVRGKRGGERMVFIHGVCGAPAWYASTMQQAVSRHGTLISLQGNIPCGQGYRDWASNPKQLNARIEAAFRAVGDPSELRDIVLIGYSLGGSYAEGLIRQYPDRYTRAILIAEPQRPQVYRLTTARGVVLMAGSRDRQDLMTKGVPDLRAAHVPSTYMVLPGATHGEMGSDPERSMSEAFDWLWANQLPAADAGAEAGPQSM